MLTWQFFDTLRFANRLKAAGVADAHAEAQAEALAGAFESSLGRLATKSDLHDVETRLTDSAREREARMNGAMRELELRLTVKLGAMLAIAIGVIATLARFGP